MNNIQRIHLPILTSQLANIERLAGYDVFTIDEFRTSKSCRKCYNNKFKKRGVDIYCKIFIIKQCKKQCFKT